MPELPEVQTTVDGLNRTVKNALIKDVWTDLAKKIPSLPHHKTTLKSADFYARFKQKVIGAKIKGARRRAKNILIDLDTDETIIIHMKMTGHLMVGRYDFDKKLNQWMPHKDEKNDALRDPYNKFIHVIFTLKSQKRKYAFHLAFSDARKFGTVTLVPTKDTHDDDFKSLGPEPLESTFTFEVMRARLNKKKTMKIKQALMDQSVIAGIGNIYSDEMLWLAGIHPEEQVGRMTDEQMKLLYPAMKKVLALGIDFGGDSTSDYRQIDGTRGTFHHHHHAYQRTGQKCGKRRCGGVILRSVVGGRSAHYCSVHQKLNTHGRRRT